MSLVSGGPNLGSAIPLPSGSLKRCGNVVLEVGVPVKLCGVDSSCWSKHDLHLSHFEMRDYQNNALIITIQRATVLPAADNRPISYIYI